MFKPFSLNLKEYVHIIISLLCDLCVYDQDPIYLTNQHKVYMNLTSEIRNPYKSRGIFLVFAYALDFPECMGNLTPAIKH